jgi:hypothetical protein
MGCLILFTTVALMRENKISSFHGLLTVKKALEEDGDAGAIATL